jgi:hypothetical protein
MVKCGVLFEVRTGFLNIIQTGFVQALIELNAPHYRRLSSAGTPDDPVHRQLQVIPTLDQIENPHDALTTARRRTTTMETLYYIVLYCIVMYYVVLYHLSIK